MRKTAIVLLVLSLLSLAQLGYTADLRAGWYANINGLDIYTYDTYSQPILRGNAEFLLSPGTYDPFVVSDGPYHISHTRYVSVPTIANGVSSDQSLILPVNLGLVSGERLAYLSVRWETDYNPEQMYLALYHRRSDATITEVWTQPIGGPRSWNTDVEHDTIVDGDYYFAVNVVPEPTSAVGLVLSLICTVPYMRRRQ